MRVMMIFGSLEAGGSERLAACLAGKLAKRNIAVFAAAMKDMGVIGDLLVETGIPLETRLLKWRYDLLGGKRIRGLVQDRGIDAVMIVDAYRNAMISTRLAGLDIPVYLWCSSVPAGQAGNFIPMVRKYLRRRVLERLVCASRWQRRTLIECGLDPEKLTVIYNGVDTDEFSHAAASKLPEETAGKPVLLHLANVMPDKDFITLTRAAGRWSSNQSPCTILLAGRDTDSRQIRELIEAGGASHSVIPLGFRRDVPGLLAACDGLVLSSRSEVLPVSILEAMAAGRPVIAPDLPALDEVFEDGREGLKFAAGDAASLCSTLECFCRDDQLRQRAGRAAEKRAQDFSLDRMTEEFISLLGSNNRDVKLEP